MNVQSSTGDRVRRVDEISDVRAVSILPQELDPISVEKSDLLLALDDV